MPKIGSYEAIDVGECFDFPSGRTPAEERPCDEPHDAEMFVEHAPTGLDAADASFPTREQWQELSATLCFGPFAEYTGIPIEQTAELSMSLIHPLEADWADVSRRTLSCVIVSADETKLVGSKHV